MTSCIFSYSMGYNLLPKWLILLLKFTQNWSLGAPSSSLLCSLTCCHHFLSPWDIPDSFFAFSTPALESVTSLRNFAPFLLKSCIWKPRPECTYCPRDIVTCRPPPVTELGNIYTYFYFCIDVSAYVWQNMNSYGYLQSKPAPHGSF